MLDIVDVGFRVNSSELQAANQELAILERSGRDAQSAIDDLEGSGDDLEKRNSTLSQSFGTLAKAIGFVGFAVVAKQFIDLSDGYKQMNAGVKIATTSTAEFAKAQDSLNKIARDARAPIQDVYSLYSNIAPALREMGRSQGETLKTTELLSKALKLGGGDAQTHASALRQLTQALGSGKLSGDEFNSVMENGRGIAVQLAKGLDIPIGALRTMSREGKLTADVIVDAMLRQETEITRVFKDIPITADQAWTLVANETIRAVGRIDERLGIAKSYSDVILKGSELIFEFGKAAVTLIDSLGTKWESFTGTLATKWDAFKKTFNIDASVAAAFAAVTGTFKSLGESLAPMAGLLAPLGQYAGAIAIGFAAVGATHIAVGLVGSAFGLAALAVGRVTAALGLMKAALLANPITAAAVLIGAAAYVIYDNWEKIEKWWADMWPDMRNPVETFASWIKAFRIDPSAAIKSAWVAYFTWWKKSWTWAAQVVVDFKNWLAKLTWTDVAKAFSDAGKNHSTNYAGGMRDGGTNIQNVAREVALIAPETIDNTLKLADMPGKGKGAMEDLADGLEEGGESAIKALDPYAAAVTKLLEEQEEEIAKHKREFQKMYLEKITLYEDGQIAVDLLAASQSGLNDEDIAAEKAQRLHLAAAEALYDQQKLSEEVVSGLATEVTLHNTAMRDGSKAAEAQRLVLEDGLNPALAKQVVETRAAMQMQREFSDALKDAIVNSDSIKEAMGNLGDWLRDWLKGMAAEFLANKLMVSVGFGQVGGGGMGGQLGSLLGGGGSPGATGGGALSSLSSLPSILGGGLRSIGSSIAGWFGGGSAAASMGGQGMLTSLGSAAPGLMGGMGGTASAGSAFAGNGMLTSYGAGSAAPASSGILHASAGGMAGIAGAGMLAYGIGDAIGAPRPDAMAIGASIGMAAGGPIGAAVLGGLGSLMGSGGMETVDSGFRVGYANGEVSGSNVDFQSRELGFFGGTSRRQIDSELNPTLQGGADTFFSDLDERIENLGALIGVSGSDALMDDFKAEQGTFRGKDAQADYEAWLEEAARDAYGLLYNSLGPALQAGVSDSVDMSTASIDEIGAVYEEVAVIAGSVVPVMKAMGLNFGETTDEMAANALALSENMGGASNTLAVMAQLAERYAPAGTLANLALDEARESVEIWNSSIGLGPTTDRPGDRTTNYAANNTNQFGADQSMSALMAEFTHSMDSATGAVELNVGGLELYIKKQQRMASFGAENAAANVHQATSLLQAYDAQRAGMLEARNAAQGYRMAIDENTVAGALAAQQFDMFTVAATGMHNGIGLNREALDTYKLSLDRSTESGEAAWQSADSLSRIFGETDGAMITTGAQLYEYIKTLDLSTEAGQKAAVAATEQYNNLLLLEAEQRRQIDTMNMVGGTLGLLNLEFDRASPLAIGAADALVQLMGGVESFSAVTNSYYENYFSEAERNQLSLAQSAAAVQVFNEGVAASGIAAITTEEGFRNYVEGLDTQTASGALAYAQAMNVNDAFKAIAEQEGGVDGFLDRLPDDLDRTFDTMVEDARIASEGLAEKAGNIFSSIDGVGGGLSLMDLAFIDMNGTLVENAAGVDGVTYQLGETLYNLSEDANGATTVIRTSVEGLAQEVQLQGDGMVDGWAENTALMYARSLESTQDLDVNMRQMVDNAGLAGTGLVDTLVESFDSVVEDADIAGDDIVQALDESFTQALAAAGVLREELPPELQAGFDQMLIAAGGAAVALRETGLDFAGTMATVGADVDGLGDAAGLVSGPANSATTAVGGVTGSLTSLAGSAESASGRIYSAAQDVARVNNNAQALLAETIRQEEARDLSSDGSHALGIDNVPWDGYRATLHKGESVNTRAETEAMRNLPTYTQAANSSPMDSARLARLVSLSEQALRVANTSADVMIDIAQGGRSQERTLRELKTTNERLMRKIEQVA